MSKLLKELLPIDSDLIIDYLSDNSQDIKENTMFFALEGANFDGHQAVDEVIKKGAKVIVHSKPLNYQEGIIYYHSAEVETLMGEVAARFFDFPSRDLNLIGITGTNGKTTIAWLLNDLLNKLHSPSGYIGTIGIEYNHHQYHNLFTTPKAIELEYHLSNMVKQGVKNCTLEISSHSLIMHRVDQLDIDFAIMSNLTFEHVNFHGSMSEYQKAKRILFEHLQANQFAILNSDDDTYQDYKDRCIARVYTYGVENKADFQAKDIKLGKNKTSFTLVYQNEEYHIKTNLSALFNVYNLLACIAVLVLKEYPLKKIIPLLEHLTLPSGRLNIINQGQNFEVIVDYAHTPDGFEKIFEYAKSIAKGKIIAVFSSAGGDRDREKRPILGEVASKYCDRIILTQEDNRNESVRKINKEIAQGIDIADVLFIDNRLEAIENAFENIEDNDVLLILGKGDDDYNVVENGIEPYEGDINIAKRLLKERGYHNEEK